MTWLTVGYVSGFIALAALSLRTLFPNLVVIPLVHLLGDEQSATTWSVAGRELQKSLWPDILKSDVATSRFVNPTLRHLLRLRRLALFIVSIAAIVTPLGLYDFFRRSSDISFVNFRLAIDDSQRSLSTKPRGSHTRFSRRCGLNVTIRCPGTDWAPDQPNIETRIPKSVLRLFQSGLAAQSSSVSGVFDIQWRDYAKVSSPNADHGEPYVVGKYGQIESQLPRNGIELVEGLVVDYDNGGIGLRSHSVPAESIVADWEEDILFIEPDTSCVDTNLTLNFHFGQLGFVENAQLVDRGGFVHLQHAMPDRFYHKTQQDPQMYARAWKGAWWNNHVTMVFMNITTPLLDPWKYLESDINKTFPIAFYSISPDRGAISMDSYVYYVDNNDRYPNPFNISFDQTLLPLVGCLGAGGLNYGNMKNIAVQCGLLSGVPRMVPDTTSAEDSRFQSFEQSIYSCASSVRATIKTVKFKNDPQLPGDLESLKVLQIKEKEYKDHSKLPIWGVEHFNRTLNALQPLWGLVDKNEAIRAGENISTVQSRRLYLPGYTYHFGKGGAVIEPSGIGSADTMNLPGATFHAEALHAVYQIHQGVYSGFGDAELSRSWRGMTTSPESSEKMINLIWTDIAANAVYGTRGWLSKPYNPDTFDEASLLEYRDTAQVPVHLYTKQVGYHWWFSVPAFLILAIFVVFLVLAAISVAFGHVRPSSVRFYLNRLTAGRLMTIEDSKDSDISTRQWIREVGHKQIHIRKRDTEHE